MHVQDDQTSRPSFYGSRLDAMVPGVYERKYELDSLCNVLKVRTRYDIIMVLMMRIMTSCAARASLHKSCGQHKRAHGNMERERQDNPICVCCFELVLFVYLYMMCLCNTLMDVKVFRYQQMDQQQEGSNPDYTFQRTVRLSKLRYVACVSSVFNCVLQHARRPARLRRFTGGVASQTSTLA